MRVAPIALFIAMLLPISAQAADAQKTLAAQRERIKTADYRVSGHLVRVDATGARSSAAITMKALWSQGVLRVLLEVASPASERARILLEMRPDGNNLVKIAHPGDTNPVILPYEKWSEGPLGAGFSYEDFMEGQYFWPGQAAGGEEKFGVRDCDVVKSTPGPADRTHFAEVTSWLDRTIGFPVYVEKRLKDGTLKEYTYFGLRKNGGVWSASQIEAKTRGRAGSTLLIIDRGTPKANLGLKDFSPAQLTHF
jgi:hypothetical protein